MSLSKGLYIGPGTVVDLSKMETYDPTLEAFPSLVRN